MVVGLEPYLGEKDIMAEIDNVRGKINLPGPEELAQDIEIPQEEEAKGPIEINEMENETVELK